MSNKSNINYRQTGRSRSANKSAISFGHFQRMAPFTKVKDFFSKFNLKNKGGY